MKQRRTGTEKISISLGHADLTTLRRRAKRLYEGNVSAVVAEFAADAALLEGMQGLVEHLGGPLLTDGERTRLDRDWAGVAAPPKKRAARRKKAA